MEAVLLVLASLLALLTTPAAFVTPGGYNKAVYLDDPSVCNMTIRLHEAMPAVLVQLSETVLVRPLFCSVQIEIGTASIAGLTAVVQELNIPDASNCSNYLQVTTYDRSRPRPFTSRLCDEWSSAVHHQEPGRSLFGGCDLDRSFKSYDTDCAVRRVNLFAHVPAPVAHVTGQSASVTPSFTIVVTSYYNEQMFGGCGSGRFLCANGRIERCIDEQLVCDGRPNCGFVNNEDEYSSTCSRRRRGAVSESDHFFATWAGFAVIVLLLVVAVSYFIRSVRWTGGGGAGGRQEAGTGSRAAARPVSAAQPRTDAPQPPPYEALYPQGPPAGLLEKKRQRPGEPTSPPPSAEERQRRLAAVPAPVEDPASPRPRIEPAAGTGGAAVTHIYVEPGASPEEPPPYSERPALRHSILLAEAVVPPG